MERGKKRILSEDDSPMYLDDDEYWKNGWYSNPNDKRLLVQDWMCSWNYTTNMAKPAGRISLILGIIVYVVCFAVIVWFSAKFEFTPGEMHLGEDELKITSGYSDVVISYDEILDLQLLGRLPDEKFRRINGGEDKRMLSGKYSIACNLCRGEVI